MVSSNLYQVADGCGSFVRPEIDNGAARVSFHYRAYEVSLRSSFQVAKAHSRWHCESGMLLVPGRIDERMRSNRRPYDEEVYLLGTQNSEDMRAAGLKAGKLVLRRRKAALGILGAYQEMENGKESVVLQGRATAHSESLAGDCSSTHSVQDA